MAGLHRGAHGYNSLRLACWVISFFFKKKSGTLSECQIVWVQIRIRIDSLSVLIWVQTVCKCYKQTTQVTISKKKDGTVLQFFKRDLKGNFCLELFWIFASGSDVLNITGNNHNTKHKPSTYDWSNARQWIATFEQTAVRSHLGWMGVVGLRGLTLKAPRKKMHLKNVVCWSCLLQIIA